MISSTTNLSFHAPAVLPRPASLFCTPNPAARHRVLHIPHLRGPCLPRPRFRSYVRPAQAFSRCSRYMVSWSLVPNIALATNSRGEAFTIESGQGLNQSPHPTSKTRTSRRKRANGIIPDSRAITFLLESQMLRMTTRDFR